VAERLKAALLKSADSKEFVGSNPTLSAKGARRLDDDACVGDLRASLMHLRVHSLRCSVRRLRLAAHAPGATMRHSLMASAALYGPLTRRR